MNLDQVLKSKIEEALGVLFDAAKTSVQIQPTNAEFEGSHTLVCFSLTKISKKKPEETAELIGQWLIDNTTLVDRYNVVKGFLNLVLDDKVWVEVFQSILKEGNYGVVPPAGKEIMVEYSSPNTNKPLHLGHLRNNFLGWSVAAIYEAAGFIVHRVQIINDRGIHICKSMAAWKLFGNGENPESSGLKGDKLVCTRDSKEKLPLSTPRPSATPYWKRRLAWERSYCVLYCVIPLTLETCLPVSQ